MTPEIDIDKLEGLARAVEGWKLDCSWTDTSEDTPAAVVGCIDEDGSTYSVATIDCDQYFSDDSGRVADFYAAANPATVLSLINRLRKAEALSAKVRELEAELKEDHWPYGATVKLVWDGGDSGYRPTIGWAKRDASGALVSAYSLSPLDPECWEVVEERSGQATETPTINPRHEGD